MVNLQSNDVGKLIHFEYLSKFDLTLEKQTRIAALIASLLAPRPFIGVQLRGLKKAAERPSAGSRKIAGRLSAGSVTAAAVRKDKERKVDIEAWSAITVAVPHM